MAKDYASRKAAKRTRKRLGKDGGPGEAERPKRERKKKNAPRRLCQGMCYNQPKLDEEDLNWRESQQGQHDAHVVRTHRRSPLTCPAHTPRDGASPAKPGSAPARLPTTAHHPPPLPPLRCAGPAQ
jgi:hypothetical protein